MTTWIAAAPRTVHIEALDVPHTRVSWPENFGTPAASNGVKPAVRDISPSGTTAGERRHHVWLAAGTYQLWLDYLRAVSGGGICEALIGAQSAGTIDTSGATSNNIWAPFPTSVVLASSGLLDVVIRKTTVAGSVQFHELVLRRTS
jgi:hypothetical protein